MRYFLFSILFSFIFVLPVAAQDAPKGILMEEDKPKTAAEEIEEMFGESEEEKALQSVYQYANDHYKRCLKVQHHVLHGKSLEMMCSCVSANMGEAMTLEQIADISKNTEEGRLQLGRMLMFVYLPCIKQPIYSTISDQCLGSQKNRYTMKNQRATCQCISERVSARMEEFAPQHIQYVLGSRINQFDPIELLIPFKSYERQHKHLSRVCIRKHELGDH